MSFKPIRDSQVIQLAALNNSIGSAANSTLDVVFSQIDSVMVNLAGLQQITNKTIGSSNSGVLANTLQFKEISTPSTNPAVNTLALYPKSDGHFYSLNSSGSEVQVGSASALPVGSVVQSFLTLAQFQSQAGSGWIISDGSSVPGSAYEALVGQSSLTASNNSNSTITGATLVFSTPVVSATGNSIFNSTSLTNIPLNTSIAAGQIVSGAPIVPGSTVSSISQYTFGLTGTPNQYTFTVHSSNVYVFTISASNATAGATYTNNGQTFTVTTTIVGGTTLITTGTGAPSASGTLTLSSGTGSATIPFSSYAYGGANATAGATYTNNGQTFTVSSTVSNGTTLVCTGTGAPLSSGTLTLATGSGDSSIVFTAFSYGGANATAGATYTNNGQTFTVVNTIVDGTVLVCTGTGFPSGSGTLTYASGTGDSTITFSSVSLSVVISNAAVASDTGTPLYFSTYVATTTGNLTASSDSITNLASTSGIATGQIVSSQYFNSYTTVSSISVTSVPDCRGLFIRGAGTNSIQTLQNGGYPSGAALGGYQQDEFASHNHETNMDQGGSGVDTINSVGAGQQQQLSRGSAPGQANLATGGSETRPVSVTANIFIRIN